jgi:hypothetical protein
MRTSGAVQDLWRQAQTKQEEHAQGLCDWEELNTAVGAFFARSVSGTARHILEQAADPAVRELKLELLQKLRQEDIYVWERGAIEDYYPPLEHNESANKNDRARTFCERHTTAEDIRGLPAFKETDHCEFDLVFAAFFGGSPTAIPGVELPQQASAGAAASAATGDAAPSAESPVRPGN